MFIEKIRTEGLAHLSYVVGSGGEAAVIDPRRDFDVYLDVATTNGCRITHVFETHRNEDLVSGAAALAARTGATVHHGPNAAGDVIYAETVLEGDGFRIGNARLEVIETPGHTDDSVSLVLYDEDSGPDAVGVFTGDALFVNDVGRTDFYPQRAREVAGLLHDSLQKLLALGDQAVVWPAHGAGSVCGSGMADREVTTIGYERANNPRLKMESREAFVEAKLAETHLTPPYFQEMERRNLAGAREPRLPLQPAALTRQAFEAQRDHACIVDVRSASAWLGAHVPGSVAIPVDMLSAFAGWILNPRDKLLLVAQDAPQAAAAARHLARIGYDHIVGFLAPSLVAWAASGGEFAAVPVVGSDEVQRRVEAGDSGWTLLDVRGPEEFADARIRGARHIHVGDLDTRLDELDPSNRCTVMCGSGARATIAASILRRAGFGKLDLFLGSIGAWRQAGLPVETAAD